LSSAERLCVGGRETCYIDPQGNVYPCGFTEERFLFGNIRSTTFREIWEEAKRFTIDNPYCYKCPGRGGLDAGEKAFVYGFVSNALNLSVQ